MALLVLDADFVVDLVALLRELAGDEILAFGAAEVLLVVIDADDFQGAEKSFG